MKKLLLIVGLLVTLGGFTVAGCLVMANRITANAHRDFFDRVATGDPQEFLDHCSNQLASEIDTPVLKSWMDQVNGRLGQFERTSANGFQCNTSQDQGSRVTEIAGTAILAGGTAMVQLNYVEGALADFRVDSDQIHSGWFTGPADTSLYQQRTVAFFEPLMNDQPLEAFSMMHEALQKQVTVESLRSMGETVAGWSGPIKQIVCVDNEFTNADGEKLIVRAELIGKTENLVATATFQFIGMKGHLMEFNVAPPSKTSQL